MSVRVAVRTRVLPQNSYPIVFGTSCVLVACLSVLHLATGSVALTPPQVVAALFGHPELAYHEIIVWDLRMPRTLIALTAGAMFGLAGAMLQIVLRNPLAEPEMTGATSGAVLFAVLWLALNPGSQSMPGSLLPFVALGGGGLAGGIVFLLCRRLRSPASLILTGLMVSAILRSCTSLVLLVRQETAGSVVLWLIGSLNGRVWVHWALLWPWALLVIPLGLALARWANLLQLGEASAVSAGLPVGLARAALLLVAVLLTASAVAVVGGIAFIGLMTPHLARKLVGLDARRVFPMSMLLGSALLLSADTLAQVALRPMTLPVGAVLAVIGVPFFLILIRRRPA